MKKTFSILFAVLVLIGSASAVTYYNTTDGVYNYTIINGTEGAVSLSWASSTDITILLVGGGASSGNGNPGQSAAASGGAGGVLFGNLSMVGTYSVVNGHGGPAVTGTNQNGVNGDNTTFSNGTYTFTAIGGGYGAAGGTNIGGSGGSGGGGVTGGSSTQTSQSLLTGYGNAGGNSNDGSGGGAGGAASGSGAAGVGKLFTFTPNFSYFVATGGLNRGGIITTDGFGNGGGTDGNAVVSYRGGNGTIVISSLYRSTTVAPTASFTSNHTSGVSPLAVQFNDTSTGSPTSWFWQFQDDITNPSTLHNPVHIFTNPGNWSVILNVTNAYGYNVSAPMWINVSQSAPITSFTGTPTTGATPLSVAFSDTSSGSPTSWNWSFGDGNYSASKNPSHVYSSIGSYTVSLNATNAIGSNISTVLNYITTHGASGFTRQDLVLSIQHTLTLTFVDSSTNQPIPVVRVVDPSSGATVNTTTGIYTGTFGYETALLYLYSDGYQSKSVSYIMSGDRSETVQLVASTKSVSSNTNVVTSPVYVTFYFIEGFGTKVSGVDVSMTPYTTSTGSFAYLQTLLGIPLGSAPMQNQTMTQASGSDGKASFYVLPTTQYNISFSAAGHTFDPPYIFTSFANPQIIYVITHSSNASFVANDVDVNSAINFNVLATPVNDTALYLNMTYLDTTGTTTSGTVDVIAENNTPYQPNTTVASWSITSSSATDSILIIHQKQLNLQVKGKFITTQFGTVNREYGFAVKGPAVSFMGFSSNIALLFALGVMMMTVMLATAMAARQVAVIMCLESWIFYSLGWLNSLIARGVPESLLLLGMTIATVASIFAVFETRKKREKY